MLIFPLLFTFALSFNNPKAQLDITVDHGDELHVLDASIPLPKVITNAVTRYVWETQIPTNLHIQWQGCTASGTCLLPRDEKWQIDATGGVHKVNGDLIKSTTARSSDHVSPFQIVSAQALLDALPHDAPYTYWGGQQNVSEFLASLEHPHEGQQELNALIDRFGWFVALLSIFLLGVALNLTPCVLPMLPINVALLGAGKDRRIGLLYGTAYALGIATCYGIIGGTLIYSGGLVGALQSTPAFNICVSILFLFLTLATLNVFRIDLSKWLPRSGGQRGVLVSFVTGAIGALLAGACVSPVVLGVLLLGSALYNSGHLIAIFLPLLLGLGMGAPWPLLGIGLHIFPKPGKWLNYVKYPFALFLFILSLYYGLLSCKLLSHKRTPTHATVSNLQLDGRNLFVDISASWCKNCAVMDRTTFADTTVQNALSQYQSIRIELEDVNEYNNQQLINRFGIKGLPAYLLIYTKDLSP